ncbi:hypothetical protein KFL_017150010 [Klebsormidium nitens]|uniref:Uncharacterized protein n=1 Tax=Klebsormidium nitens TaxID=105231 RepID=A0A1Y1IXX2_KLENI|nr:hypothetical protein KFL_017150010 [Klebsormidium nitens]|eukprot:GAQ93617.1 hypothetical protein KFL_017150010 [Klebsormidium nitens]
MGEIVDISTKSLLELLEPPAPSVEETGEVLDAASSLLDISSTDGRRLWQMLFEEEMPEVRPPEEEKKDHMIAGDEMLVIDRNRPWLKDAPRQYVHTYKKKPAVTYDVSVALYVKKAYPDVHVDMIMPDDASLARLRKNDMYFLLIFDIVDSWHSKTTEARKSFVKAITEADNVFPSGYYQRLVAHKNLYYDYLRKAGIPVADFLYFSSSDYKKGGAEGVIRTLRRQMKAKKWKDFVAKPVLGQGSADFKFFPASVEDHRLAGYLEKIFKVGYPGVIFQVFIEGFADDTPEFRQFYVEKRYMYTMITDEQHEDERQPKSEGGTFQDNKQLRDARRLGDEVIAKLPPQFTVGKIALPRLLTRVDVGCCLNGKMFCSEVEYVPSLFINSVKKLKIDAELAEQAVAITREFLRLKRTQ